MGRQKKFGMRIRKMKPEPMTITRTKRRAWGKVEKEQETVLGTLLFSLICIQCSCINRRANLEDDDIPTTDQYQGQVCTEKVTTPSNVLIWYSLCSQIEAGSADRTPARMDYRPISLATYGRHDGASSPTPSYSGDGNMHPNLIQVLEAVREHQPFGFHE